MKDILKALGILALIIGIPGGIYLGVEIYWIMKIDYEIAGYKLKSINSKNINIEFALKVINPSHVDIGINGYDINVYINKIHVANLVSKNKKELKAKTKTNLVLPIDIDMGGSLAVVKSKDIIGYFLTKNYEKIIVSFDGKFLGRAIGIPINAPIKMEYTLAEIIKIMDTPTITKIT